MVAHDIVLRRGRVVDPESGLDAIRDVGIDGRTVTAVSEDHLQGVTVIDATGLVVAPGFIDLHSHAQTLAGRRLQACDGVTTALDLEVGRAPVERAYALEEANGSPIHYGFSASWAAARMQVLTGAVPDGGIEGALGLLGSSAWKGPITPAELGRVVDHVATELAAGAIGIGILLGYAPATGTDEYLALARLAAETGNPTFTHGRDLIEVSGGSMIDGAEEIVQVAAGTGAHMHYCHVNSTSGRHIDRVHALIERCRAEGGRVSTEAYPYGSGATAVGAAFLAPERLRQRKLTPASITHLRTGERLADDAQLLELRSTAPGDLVLIDFLNENDPADRAALRRALAFEDAVVASDALPPVPGPAPCGPEQWPLGPGQVTHPRSAGCFSRALRLWREEGTPLIEAVGRCTLLPARLLEATCPVMRGKGRVQPGAAADIVVFDAERVTDMATYSDSTRPSSGIRHLLVDGVRVVRDGELVTGAHPGGPVRAKPL